MTKAKEILENTLHITCSNPPVLLERTLIKPEHLGLKIIYINQALTALKSGLKERLPRLKANAEVSEYYSGSNACLTKVHQAIDDYFEEGA